MTQPRIHRRTLFASLAGTLATVAVATACSPGNKSTGGSSGATGGSGAVFSKDAVTGLVSAIVHKTPKQLPAVALADGVTPPTNRWFSGMVFGANTTKQPAFPLPMGFTATGTGFGFGLPTITPMAKTIAGGYAPMVSVTVPGVKTTVVSRYDEASVSLELRDASGNALGTVTIAEGSPLVGFVAASDLDLTVAPGHTAQGSHWIATMGAGTYLLTGDVTVSGTKVSVKKGGNAVWLALPQGADAEKLAPLARPVTGTSVSYDVGSSDVTTTLAYQAGGDTLFVAMPHHQAGLVDAGTELGSYSSIFGTLKLFSGSKLSWKTATYAARTGLDLSKLSADQKSELATQVAKDVTSSPAYPADTYFGGKALYRDAMLFQIATQTGATDAASTVKQRLTAALEQWTQPQGANQRAAFCFVYDEQGHGLIGLQPSFGSDEYNDHHFHYGYFLYAAGVMAADDADLAKKLAPVMNLVAAELASSDDTGLFPRRRTFDAYASHSWASGFCPFADGNNQESSSEAVNAWAGLTLWARAAGDKQLELEATWMHALEAQATRAYWTNYDLSDPVYKGFGHKVMGMNWGAKRDYATWFSPEPAAVLAIQLLPMNPSSDHLAGDASRIAANVAEGTATKGFNQTYGDYILMYSAMAGADAKAKALDAARKFSVKLDDGNSRSYMLAFIMTR